MSFVKKLFASRIITGAAVLVFFSCVGCAQHYCPTYSSRTYNQSFTYAPEKSLAYKPVKVHEFDKKRLVKSSKKDKGKATLR